MPIEFKQDMAAYAVGRRINMEEYNTLTRTAEGAIGFGVPVMAGTGEHGTLALDGTSGRNVLGISEANQVLNHTGDAYAQYDNVTICESGVIGVLLGADVTKGAVARFNTANGTWTGAAQSATVVTIPGAQFEYGGQANAVGAVRYRRPVPSLSVSGA
jgi:hypothetical protein